MTHVIPVSLGKIGEKLRNILGSPKECIYTERDRAVIGSREILCTINVICSIHVVTQDEIEDVGFPSGLHYKLAETVIKQKF